MTPRQFQRASELSLEACGLEPDAREPFLDAECDDEQMRAAVEAWLNEDASPQALDRGVDVMPHRIGHYEIVRLLGEGSMGTAYEARQEEPRRHVALKVIRAGALLRNLLRRFRHEVRMLGQLQHPGIAQIYEARTVDEGEGGRPYFAMELVTGSSLREYTDEHELGTRQRLALLAEVCDRLHHAHQLGVYRDLKPGNSVGDVQESLTQRGREGPSRGAGAACSGPGPGDGSRGCTRASSCRRAGTPAGVRRGPCAQPREPRHTWTALCHVQSCRSRGARAPAGGLAVASVALVVARRHVRSGRFRSARARRPLPPQASGRAEFARRARACSGGRRRPRSRGAPRPA